MKAHFLKSTLTTSLISGLMLSSISLADMHDETKIETTKINDSLYMIVGQGGNMGVSSGEDGIFVIDDQFAPLTPKIKQAISKISEKSIRYVINTHWHFDHVGGNENFAKDNAVIVAHDNVRERMSKEGFIKAFNKKVPASPKTALPVITFKEGISFHLNGEEISVMHQSNAHTDGDSIVWFKSSNVIHTGDIFFNGLYPFIDASSNGDIKGVISAVDYILSLSNDDTVIIPGHGSIADKAALENYQVMLKIVQKRMQTLIAEGKTLDEIIALKPNADLDVSWGKGFLSPEAFLNVLHSTVAQ